MPKIEIDEETWNAQQRTMATLGLIAKNPKAKKLVEQAHKLIDPNAPTPTIEAEAPLEAALTEVNKTIAELRKERDEEKAAAKAERDLNALKARQDDGWARLRQDRTWTPAGLEKVQEIMNQKGILDPEDAAVIFLRDNPPPPPAMPGGTGAWNFLETPADDQVDIKKLIETKGENAPLLEKMTREALAEVRGSTPSRR
jgi:ribosome assembly protein YihI (activator of Der GTPase)